MEKRIVRKIEIQPVSHKKIALMKRKRVAAYARVSTSSEDQLNSITAQKSYYEQYIRNHVDWEFVGLYADEGVTGLSHLKRTEFKRMIADAESGKIELIVTKSISRFARNTVDTLTYVRRLKEKGVAIYFEKEDINSLEVKGEFLITLLSSMAQEESRSISENITWGKRKRMADGIYSMPYARFLGYEKKNDVISIVLEEAAVIRYIYYMFLLGMTTYAIANKLNENGIKTPSGRDSWKSNVVRSILKNEKYCGNALLQKTYTTDYLTKTKKKNRGELPCFFVENGHEGIVSVTVWDEVQRMLKLRDKTYSCRSVFSRKLVCSLCGRHYYRRFRYYETHGRTPVVFYNCRGKYDRLCKCQNILVHENDLVDVFSESVYLLLQSKFSNVINEVKRALDGILSADKLRTAVRYCKLSVKDGTRLGFPITDLTMDFLIHEAVLSPNGIIRVSFRNGSTVDLNIRYNKPKNNQLE